MKKRPHIIIFNPDEMRWDTMGHMGNPAAKTPFLDRFASEEAVSFSNAFCQNPVCVPSRCSFFTGLYPHTTGHRTMGYLLQPQETSLLKELKEAGYFVWANARNDLIAGEYAGLIESHVSKMYYGGNSVPAPGPVSDHPRGCPGNPEFYSFCNGRLKTDEKGLNYSEDDEDVDAAIDVIRHHKGDRPLCLFVGTLCPHPPYNVEDPYFSSIDRTKLPERLNPENAEGKAKMLTNLRKYQNLDNMTDAQWDELRATYLAMCSKVDAQFERLCYTLKETGIYDDSAIFFLSDHGDYAGDYGVVEKAQNCFEDRLTRVPLLIKPPKGEELDAGICDSLVELVDFYATVLHYAGVEAGHSHFGISLVPAVADRHTLIREDVFCEGGRNADEAHCAEAADPAIQNGFRYSIMWPRYAAQFDNEAHAKGAMVRTKEWKYIYRAKGDCELYDLTEDPDEMKNLVHEPKLAGVILDLKSRLLDWYQETADVVPFHRDSRFSNEMIWEKVKTACPAGHEAQVKEKIAQTGNMFLVKDFCKKLEEGQY